MISPWLLSVLRCPDCVHKHPHDASAMLTRDGNALVCPTCHARYHLHADYVDMRPRAALVGKETIYNDPSVDLDDPVIRAPVLSAGVRQRVLQLLLCPVKADRLLEIGCGNGKFAVWNQGTVRHMVGLDPAARFAAKARATIDLVQGDARALPFAPGTFTGAYSIDVFEHLDHNAVRAHLRETCRTLTPTGRYFCFSNTRERSWLNRLIDPGRCAAEALHRAGLVDRTRDHLRKGDHVKAVETTDALAARIRRSRSRCAGDLVFEPPHRHLCGDPRLRDGRTRLTRRRPDNHAAAESAPITGNDPAGHVPGTQPVVRIALRLATSLLMADVSFFRAVRTGPFFLLARPARRR